MSTDNCESSNFLKRACNPAGDSGGGGGGGSTSPGGSNTQVQYNNTGSFGGSSDFTYDGDKVSIKTLLVTGEAYIEHAEDLYIGDPLITLNSGVTAPNTYDIGFIGDRGASDNIGLIWDESADTSTDNGSTIGNVPIDSYKSIKAGDVGGTGVGDRITLNGTPYLLSGDAVEGAAGSTNQIQYNNGGSFAGSNDLTWDGSQLSVSGRLEVVDDSDAQILAKGWSPDSVGNDGGAIQLGQAATYHGMLSYDNAGSTLYIDNAYNNNNGKIHFRTKTNSTAVTGLTINGDGNVGIEAEDPVEKLDVSGSIKAGHLKIEEGNFGGRIGFNRNPSNGAIYDNSFAAFQINGAQAGVDYLDFQAYDNASVLGGQMVLHSGGNVGIGYPAPDVKLEVDGGDDDSEVFRGRSDGGNGNNVRFSFKAYSDGGGAGYGGGFKLQTRDSTNVFHERLTVQSDGNVGIGTGVANQRLEVQVAGGQDIVFRGVADDSKALIDISKNTDGDTIFNNSHYLDGSDGDFLFTNGNVGIGNITAASRTLDVNGSYSQPQMRVGFDTSGNGLIFQAQGDTNHYNWLISQQSFTDTSLEFTPSATTGSQTFSVPVFGINKDGDVRVSGSLGVGLEPSGTVGSIVASNDVVAYASSDERLKDNIAPIPNALNKVTQINGVEFDWNENAYEHLAGHDVGVIAQNIESVLPEVVATRDDGYKAVRYEKIVPLLIEAIKDQQKQINELKSKIK